MSGPYYISCSSPTADYNVLCSGTERIKQYISTDPTNGNLILGSAKSRQFYLSYVGNIWRITTSIDGVSYYVTNGFSGLQITQNTGSNSSWMLQIYGPNNTITNINNLNGINSVFIGTPDSDNNNGDWILTYSKDMFGGYGNNQYPTMDRISQGTPINTNNRTIPCNYIWNLE